MLWCCRLCTHSVCRFIAGFGKRFCMPCLLITHPHNCDLRESYNLISVRHGFRGVYHNDVLLILPSAAEYSMIKPQCLVVTTYYSSGVHVSCVSRAFSRRRCTDCDSGVYAECEVSAGYVCWAGHCQPRSMLPLCTEGCALSTLTA